MILRHASPAQQGPDGTDFTRPLTELGEAEARIQGRFLCEAGIIPELIVTSFFNDTATTAALLTEALGTGQSVVPEAALYNAPGTDLLDCVQGLPDDVGTALLVAHMPGVAELLAMLASELPEVAVAFKPGTLVGISLERVGRWAEVAPGGGVLEWLLPPLLAP